MPKIAYITAGYRHSAVIAESGELYGWGGSCADQALAEAKSTIAQLGEGISALGAYGSVVQADLTSRDPGECATQGSTFVQSKTPQRLQGMNGRAAEISAGYGHLLARTEDGALYSAGCNSFEQLGRIKATGPRKNDLAKVNLPGKITKLSAGFRHSVVLLDDGTVWVWGYNGFGSALHVDSREFTIREPGKVKIADKVSVIEAAHDTTFVLTATGKLLGWGQDDAQAFWGMQTSREIHEKGTVPKGVSAISAGMQHVVVLGER